MKKLTYHSVSLLFSLFFILNSAYKVYSIDYTISFTGSGASTTLDSVIVQNLTRSTSVKVLAGYQLNLNDVTAVEQIEADYEIISIIPNPITDKSVVSFYVKQAGNTQINVVGLDGRILTGINCNLPEGKNSFQLLLDKGAYIFKINGNGYSYSSMILSRSGFGNKTLISFIGNEKTIQDKPQKSKNSDVVNMTYSSGDQLLYKGYSGNFCTIVTDKLTKTKTIDFKFVDCTDADSNHYGVVYIGTQTWMVENLKTTRYRNGDAIPNVTDNTSWVFLSTGAWCNYNNDAANSSKYGKLYNYFAVSDDRKIAPEGWHVPSEAEWTTLETYLIANGYNYDGTTTNNKIAKALAATTDWNTSTVTGAVGNDLTKNNSTGFKALPGGFRGSFGKFANIGSYGIWWSSTEYGSTNVWPSILYYYGADLYRSDLFKNNGSSVRCIRD